MFIDVVRYGGDRVLRLNIGAIAYIDATEGGSSIHLIGGETLRVGQDPDQLEARVDAMLGFAMLVGPSAGDLTLLEAEIYTKPGTATPAAPTKKAPRK